MQRRIDDAIRCKYINVLSVICLKATQIPNLKSNRVNLLPQLKGTGLVYDSLIAYNLDPEFKALATKMSTNMPRVATEFSTFLEHYSGYTAYVNELQEKYSIENFQMQEVDKQAWIVERFEATDKDTFTTFQTYTTIKTNTNHHKTLSTSKEYFASIKKHFCTITCQENSWHVAQNNQDFKLQNKAA